MNSQIGQDKWVCEYFNYKRDGYFLDIGAFDGTVISNTYYMEKELGWNGICVEAGLKNFEKLVQNRQCFCLHAAIGEKDEEGYFEENWTVGKLSDKGHYVDVMTFKTFMESFDIPKVIDYISLDIEGSELIALKTFPFKSFNVTLWTIETNAHLDGGLMRDQIRSLMTENGYTYVDSGYEFEDFWRLC